MENNFNKKQKSAVTLPVLVIIILLALCTFFASFYMMKEKGDITASSGQRASNGSGEIIIGDTDSPLAGNANTSEGNKDTLIAQAKSALKLCNDERAKEGLSAIVWSDDLSSCAAVRAQEATVNWAHTRPNGHDFWTVDQSIMYGENLGKGFSSAEAVVKAWMNSPTHRENIMNPDYITCGISIFVQNGNWYWAEEFGY